METDLFIVFVISLYNEKYGRMTGIIDEEERMESPDYVHTIVSRLRARRSSSRLLMSKVEGSAFRPGRPHLAMVVHRSGRRDHRVGTHSRAHGTPVGASTAVLADSRFMKGHLDRSWCRTLLLRAFRSSLRGRAPSR